MPQLTNQRHELFAQGLAAGNGITKSYVEAGYKEGPANAAAASRLLRHVKVAARVAEIQGRAAQKVEIDRAFVMKKLLEIGKAAYDAEQFGASNKSFELLGKEIGMFVERKEIRHGSLDQLSDGDLERIVTEHIGVSSGAGDIGAPAGTDEPTRVH